VALVLYFCVAELLLLELPLLGYAFAPERTDERVKSFRAWMAAKGRSAAVLGATVIAVWLLTRGLITLV
jgi:hypothetical protein